MIVFASDRYSTFTCPGALYLPKKRIVVNAKMRWFKTLYKMCLKKNMTFIYACPWTAKGWVLISSAIKTQTADEAVPVLRTTRKKTFRIAWRSRRAFCFTESKRTILAQLIKGCTKRTSQTLTHSATLTYTVQTVGNKNAYRRNPESRPDIWHGGERSWYNWYSLVRQTFYFYPSRESECVRRRNF